MLQMWSCFIFCPTTSMLGTNATHLSARPLVGTGPGAACLGNTWVASASSQVATAEREAAVRQCQRHIRVEPCHRLTMGTNITTPCPALPCSHRTMPYSHIITYIPEHGALSSPSRPFLACSRIISMSSSLVAWILMRGLKAPSSLARPP
jgi:hypothetical protein